MKKTAENLTKNVEKAQVGKKSQHAGSCRKRLVDQAL